MKFSNTWFIISIMVMSVSVFYLVVHTLLVVERSNRAVEQPAKLREILTEDQLSHLQGLVDDRKITMDWVQNTFVPRINEELEHLDWIEQGWDIDLNDPKYASHREAYASEREKALASVEERRRTLFDRALNQNVFQRAQRELETAHRTLLTGEIGDGWKLYLKEESPIGVTRDVGKSIVTFISRGIATTAKTLSEGGFGEHPVKSLAEITVAIPFILALVRLTLRMLGQIVLPFIFSMPKVLWAFILDRVRDLGKAIRDEK